MLRSGRHGRSGDSAQTLVVPGTRDWCGVARNGAEQESVIPGEGPVRHAQGSAAQREDSHVQSADAMNFATRGPYEPGCGARSVAQRSHLLGPNTQCAD